MVRRVALVAAMALVGRVGRHKPGVAQMEWHRRLHETAPNGPKGGIQRIAASQRMRLCKKRPVRHKLLRDSVSLQSVLLAPSNAK